MNEWIKMYNANEHEQFLEKFDDKKIKDNFRSYFQESAFWEAIQNDSTPLHLIKEREGAYDKETGGNVILEYFSEEYTITELNRLFPGWWMEGMKRSNWEEMASMRSAVVEGYLCVEYPTANGLKISKKWAIGGHAIAFKKDNRAMPVSIEDTLKAAHTDWLKIAGKRYGIGLDIYHQRITPDLRRAFEDTVREWGSNADKIKEVASTLTTGHGFRSLLKTLPNPEQNNKFLELIAIIPKSKQQVFWDKFLTLSNTTHKHTAQFDKWLDGVQAVADKIKQNKEK